MNRLYFIIFAAFVLVINLQAQVTIPLQQFTEMNIPLTGVSSGSVAWGDYDNDNDIDILLTGSSEAKIYRNDGYNTFTEQTLIVLEGIAAGSADWGDYNNDGYLDILLTGNTGSERVSKIYGNNGGNNFIEQTSISLTGVDYGSVAWGDYDNDGFSDILLTGDGGSKIYKNNKDSTFTEQTSIILAQVYESSVAWGDYDNDDDLDILLTGWVGQNGVTIIYRNEGNNNFSEQPLTNLIAVNQSSVAWGDYDNDGYLDILLTGQADTGGGVSKIYRNNGDNTFTELMSLTGVINGSVAWGDYDNDGFLDILITGSERSIIYRNNGDNTFTEQTSIILAQVYQSSVAWGDYDNDDDLDILLSGDTGSGNISKIYRNNNVISNTLPISPTNLTSSVDNTNVTLSWDKSTDNETLQNGLTYNLVIGSTPNSVNTLSPMSDRNTGYRRVIKLGNTNHNNSWTIKDLAPGTYYWSVQAIDNSFAGSQFATEKSFTITPNNQPTLTWTGEPGYESDGVNPDEGNTSSTFTFRVKYTDADDDAPLSGYPKLHIEEGGYEIEGSPWYMSQVLGENPSGSNGINKGQLQNEVLELKNNSKSELLDESGNVKNKKGPMISELFESPNNPQVNSFIDGEIYTVDVPGLYQASNYSYYFEAVDVNGDTATGEATIEQSGPIVSVVSNWVAQNSGVVQNLNGVEFVDSLSGWAVGDGGIIIHTTDGGTTWAQQTSGTSNNLYSLAFPDKNIGYAVGDATILKTIDGGVNWLPYTTIEDLRSVSFANVINGWAASYTGAILRTQNGGSTWVQMRAGGTSQLNAIEFINSKIGWAVGEDYLILKSTDAGTSWTTVLNAPVGQVLRNINFIDVKRGWAIGSNGNGEIIKSTDGATTWATQTNYLNTVYWAIQFIDSSKGWMVGNESESKIINTTDGGNSWNIEPINSGSNLSSISISPTGPAWVVGEGGLILKNSTIFIPPLLRVTSPNGGEVLEAGKSILISWWDNFEGNVKISLFQGSTFIKYITNDTPNDGEYYWVIPDSLLPASNYQIKIISKNNTSITDKSDGFFSVVTPTLPYVTMLYPNGGESFESGLTYSIKWYDNFEDSVKISLFRGPEFIQYLTTGTPSDGEYSWIFPIETIPDSVYQIKIINKKTSSILDKSDESFKVIEGTSTPFIHVLSPNDGENWQVGTTHDITWDDNISDNVKIVLFKGSTLYKTLSKNNPSNGLYSWTIDPTTTPATNYKIKITRKSDKTLFDKSDKNFTISASGFAKELSFMNDIPTEFKLFQNYPNPFNPNTQIIYGIPEDSNVKIEIFNLLGELVEVLIDEFKNAGYYTENLNIKKRSSGIYIYRIQAGSFVETKKMILMK